MSKRRKTSPTTSIPVGVSRSDFAIDDEPTTPTRASYKSPTRASLARSHPDILSRSPGRRLSEARGKKVAQEILRASKTPKSPRVSENISERQQETEARNSESSANLTHGNLFRPNSAYVPELPPTPTELGLSPKPRRARGLANSSPGSRGSRRSRLASVQTSTSSPLKPKGNMQEVRNRQVEEEVELDIPKDVLESEAGPEESTINPTDDTVTQLSNSEIVEEVASMRGLRDDIKAQLVKLQTETLQLEEYLASGGDESDIPADVMTLLTGPNVADAGTNFGDGGQLVAASLKNPISLTTDPLTFLRTFAPGDLDLHTNTRSFMSAKVLYQSHTVNLTAPPPWPPHVYSNSLRVTCDVEAKRIVSVVRNSLRGRPSVGLKEVRHWIERRLEDPLHRLDCGTIVWGLGMWWKEAVARAQFFKYIDSNTRAGKNSKTHIPYQSNTVVSSEDVESLLPYLGKAFVELMPAEAYSNKASTCELRKTTNVRLLLKWDIELDWAGEVHADISVAGAKISAPGQEGLQKVFKELVNRRGIDIAVRHMLDVCGEGVGKKKNR